MKKNQAYVVRCHTKPPTGAYDDFRRNTYVSWNSGPVRNINNAHLFRHGEDDFAFDDIFTWGSPEEYFEAVPVSFVED